MKEELIKELYDLPSVSGDEHELLTFVKQYFMDIELRTSNDRLGSLIVTDKNTSKHTLMISVNGDEWGWMICDKENYRYKLLEIGSIPTTLNNEVYATIITRYHNRIDAIIKKENDVWYAYPVTDEGIKLGDTIVHHYMKYRDEIIISNQLKNRAGVQLLMELGNNNIEDCALVITTNSVVGQRAAITSVSTVDPEVSIILDADYVKDYRPNTIYLRYFDRGMLPNRKWLKVLKDIGESIGLDVVPHFSQSINDSSFIHKTGKGTPSVVLVIPMLLNSNYLNIMDTKVVDTTVMFLKEVIQKLKDRDIRLEIIGEAYDQK